MCMSLSFIISRVATLFLVLASLLRFLELDVWNLQGVEKEF